MVFDGRIGRLSSSRMDWATGQAEDEFDDCEFLETERRCQGASSTACFRFMPRPDDFKAKKPPGRSAGLVAAELF